MLKCGMVWKSITKTISKTDIHENTVIYLLKLKICVKIIIAQSGLET